MPICFKINILSNRHYRLILLLTTQIIVMENVLITQKMLAIKGKKQKKLFSKKQLGNHGYS